MGNKTSLRKNLLQRTGGKCFYCGVRLFKKRKGHRAKATIDHYIPKAEGGSNARENLVPACSSCNKEKGRLMPDEFRPGEEMKGKGK